jgi:condensin complex subunit 1
MGVGDQALEEEMGLAGAEAEDAELMLVEQIIEQKIASGTHSLLAQITPAIVCMIREPGTFSDESLQLACALSLVRIMMLSKRMCEEHIQLLFTLMEKSPNPAIRSQLIVGIGDLVYRFPNSLERWTTHLYLPLRDTRSELVRLNTLRVLSHLILKELIKTRGQIYEIALCTIDPEPQIAALAKLFFQELAQINNGIVIYNLMPDIISHLSDNGSGEAIQSTQAKNGGGLAAREITEESFRTVVTYLFTFIKRDKQCETLIEKLCTSFRTANVGERKCRDLAFCLSKVQLSDSGIKKLKECFKCYADKLYIQLVYDTFKNTILKNARKVATRDEVRHIIDELEKQIDEVKQKGIEVDQ